METKGGKCFLGQPLDMEEVLPQTLHGYVAEKTHTLTLSLSPGQGLPLLTRDGRP